MQSGFVGIHHTLPKTDQVSCPLCWIRHIRVKRERNKRTVSSSSAIGGGGVCSKQNVEAKKKKEGKKMEMGEAGRINTIHLLGSSVETIPAGASLGGCCHCRIGGRLC